MDVLRAGIEKVFNDMEFNDVLNRRYSCRAFAARGVEREKVDRILEAGRIARLKTGASSSTSTSSNLGKQQKKILNAGAGEGKGLELVEYISRNRLCYRLPIGHNL